MDSNKVVTVVIVPKDVSLRFELPLYDCRGQRYDEAAGAKGGVATQIIQEEPRAAFKQCYEHILNLAVGDTIKQNKILRNGIEVAEIFSMKQCILFYFSTSNTRMISPISLLLFHSNFFLQSLHQDKFITLVLIKVYFKLLSPVQRNSLF